MLLLSRLLHIINIGQWVKLWILKIVRGSHTGSVVHLMADDLMADDLMADDLMADDWKVGI